MSDRALNAVGVAAAVVALAAAAALALAIFVCGDADSALPRPRGRTVVIRPPSAPLRAPASPARAGAASHPGPVPALAARPARGPAFAIARLRPGARVALWSGRGAAWSGCSGRARGSARRRSSRWPGRARGWLGVDSPELPDGELGWIRRDPARVAVYWTKYSVHVDLSALTLSLRYGSARVTRFLITVGAPGSETPAGRYGITDALRFHESPFYGCCALALSGRQTHLPEGWIGGDRLAIHGTPGPVGGAESHGCIRASDADMRELFRRVPVGTPVFIDE